MEENSSSVSVIDKIWRIFSSMKLGLALLGIIAAVSAIGTIVPQGTGNMAHPEANPTIWAQLGFTNIYGSFYFRLLLGLLCLNLIVCSTQRFKGIYLKSFKPELPGDPAKVPQKVRREIEGSDSRLKDKVRETLQARGFILKLEDQDDGWSFVGNKKRLGNWGSLITHIAFVILVLGALIGSIGGFKGFMMAEVGSTNPIQTIQVEKGSVTENFSVKINSFEPRFLPTGERENWYTDLTIIDKDGREVARKTISTNHPFTYKGITLYQTSWAVKFTIDLEGQQYPGMMYEGSSTGPIQLPGTDFTFNIDIGQNLHEPGVYYKVTQGSEQIKEGQITAGQTVEIHDKCKVTVDGWVTGLQAKQDPGIPFVWLGSGLLLLGLFFSFYWRPVKISGVFEATGSGTGKLTMGIATGKVALESQNKELDEIIEKITEA